MATLYFHFGRFYKNWLNLPIFPLDLTAIQKMSLILRAGRISVDAVNVGRLKPNLPISPKNQSSLLVWNSFVIFSFYGKFFIPNLHMRASITLLDFITRLSVN
jgi:hypothetical protein